MKKLRIILLAILPVLFFLVFILFTTNKPRLEKSANIEVKVIGNIPKNKKKSSQKGVAGGKDLCAPESPFGECWPPEGSVWAGERETLELELNNDQLAAIVNKFKPRTLLLTNIKFKIKEGKGSAEATSLYPIAPGVARAEIELTKATTLEIKSITLGRIPLADKLMKSFQYYVNEMLLDTLASYGVTVAQIRLHNGILYAYVTTPKGLVEITETGKIIINANVIEQPEEQKSKDHTIF